MDKTTILKQYDDYGTIYGGLLQSYCNAPLWGKKLTYAWLPLVGGTNVAILSTVSDDSGIELDKDTKAVFDVMARLSWSLGLKDDVILVEKLPISDGEKSKFVITIRDR